MYNALFNFYDELGKYIGGSFEDKMNISKLHEYEDKGAKFLSIDKYILKGNVPLYFALKDGVWRSAWKKFATLVNSYNKKFKYEYCRSIIKENINGSLITVVEKIEENEFNEKYRDKLRQMFYDYGGEKSITWSSDIDEMYEDRGTYRLIVDDRRIVGSIYGGFFNAWVNTAQNGNATKFYSLIGYETFNALMMEYCSSKYPSCHVFKAYSYNKKEDADKSFKIKEKEFLQIREYIDVQVVHPLGAYKAYSEYNIVQPI